MFANVTGFISLDGKKGRLTPKFINEIYDYCKKVGTVSRREIFLNSIGTIPIGVDEEILETRLFLYNPDNVFGYPFEEIKEMLERRELRTEEKKNRGGEWINEAPFILSLSSISYNLESQSNDDSLSLNNL